MASIGISVGSSSCKVAYCRDNDARPEIIANEQGFRTTTTALAFNDVEILYGEDAVQQVAKNSANTIFAPQKYLFHTFAQLQEQDGFTLKNGALVGANGLRHVKEADGSWKYEVTFKGQVCRFSPQEILVLVFQMMKAQSEAFIGKPVEAAILAHPENAGGELVAQMVIAAQKAGMTVQQLISAPVAAVLEHTEHDDSDKSSRFFMACQLSGAGASCSIVRINGGLLECVAHASTEELTWGDLERELVELSVQDIEKKLKVSREEIGKKALLRLKQSCQSAIKTLSSSDATCILVDNICDNADWDMTIQKTKFERVIEKLIEPVFVDVIEDALEEAALLRGDLTDLILLGGGAKIPLVRRKIIDLVKGIEGEEEADVYHGHIQVHSTVPSDEAATLGAAAQANILYPYENAQEGLKVLDTVPCLALSLGLETLGQRFTKILPEGTSLPASRTVKMTTEGGDLVLAVWEGEREFVKDCHLLGSAEISNLPEAGRGDNEVSVNFSVSLEGVLTVTAAVAGKGSAVLRFDQGQPVVKTAEEAAKLKEISEEQRAADSEQKDLFWARDDVTVAALERLKEDPADKLALESLQFAKTCTDREALGERLDQLE